MSRQPKGKKTTRVQLELDERAMKRLHLVKNNMEAVSYSEVIRRLLIDEEKRMNGCRQA